LSELKLRPPKKRDGESKNSTGSRFEAKVEPSILLRTGMSATLCFLGVRGNPVFRCVANRNGRGEEKGRQGECEGDDLRQTPAQAEGVVCVAFTPDINVRPPKVREI